MSLSSVTGTKVPETANGVVPHVSLESSPHVSVSVKCQESRLPGLGEVSEERSLEHTENHVDVENSVYEGKDHLDKEMDLNEGTSSLSLHSPQVAKPSLSTATTAEAGSKDISETTKDHPVAVLLWDSSQHGQSKDSFQLECSVTTTRQQTEEETVDAGTVNLAEEEEEEEEDGEKEKQDDEYDEKHENKGRSQHAGRRTEEVSGLTDYFLTFIRSVLQSVSHTA